MLAWKCPLELHTITSGIMWMFSLNHHSVRILHTSYHQRIKHSFEISCLHFSVSFTNVIVRSLISHDHSFHVISTLQMSTMNDHNQRDRILMADLSPEQQLSPHRQSPSPVPPLGASPPNSKRAAGHFWSPHLDNLNNGSNFDILPNRWRRTATKDVVFGAA